MKGADSQNDKIYFAEYEGEIYATSHSMGVRRIDISKIENMTTMPTIQEAIEFVSVPILPMS